MSRRNGDGLRDLVAVLALLGVVFTGKILGAVFVAGLVIQ